jgi:hypothetical protein
MSYRFEHIQIANRERFRGYLARMDAEKANEITIFDGIAGTFKLDRGMVKRAIEAFEAGISQERR